MVTSEESKGPRGVLGPRSGGKRNHEEDTGQEVGV